MMVLNQLRIIALAFLLLTTSVARAEPPVLPLPWVKLSEIYYTPSQVRMYGANTGQDCAISPCNAVYVLTHTSDPYGPQEQDIPHTVDLRPYGVGADAKVAWLAGVLIITHGFAEELAELRITFAAEGSPIDCTRYIGQVGEAKTGSGQRSTESVMVPLNAGKFQYCYSIKTSGIWPANSSYAINLSLQAWGR